MALMLEPDDGNFILTQPETGIRMILGEEDVLSLAQSLLTFC